MDNFSLLTNITFTSNFSNLTESSPPTKNTSTLRIFFCILLTIITLTTIFANSFVLFLFAKGKKTLRNPAHYLLANLALADLAVGILVMPALTVWNITSKWYFGPFLCSAFDYVHFLLCATSMLSAIAVGFERLIGVKYPLKHKFIVTRRRVKMVIVGVWTLAILLIWIPLGIWQQHYPGIPYLCIPNLQYSFVRYVGFVVYLVPVSISVFLYILIFITARKKMDLRHLPESQATKTLRAKTREVSIAKRISLVVAIIVIMFLPLFVMFILKGLDSPLFNWKVLTIFAWWRYFNSTVNPFVYALAVPGYKAEFYRIFYNGDLNLDLDEKEDVETTINSSSLGNKHSESEVKPSIIIGSETETSKRVSLKPDPLSSPNLRRYRIFCPGCGKKVVNISDSDKLGFCTSCISDIKSKNDPISSLKEVVDNTLLQSKEKVELVRQRGSTILLGLKDMKDTKIVRQSILEPLKEKRDEIKKGGILEDPGEDFLLFEEVDSLVTLIERHLSELCEDE